MAVKLTKELIEQKVYQKDANWFYRVFDNGDYEYDENIQFTKEDIEEINNNVEQVYHQHYGDGNDYYITFYFKNFDFYVSIEGCYSSYGTNEFDKVYFSKPYEYKETRYEPLE